MENDISRMTADIKRWGTERIRIIDEYAKGLREQMLTEITAETPVSDRDHGRGNYGAHLRDSWGTFDSQLKNHADTKIYGVRAAKNNKYKITHLVAFGHKDYHTGRRIPGNDFLGRAHNKYQELLENKIDEVMNNG